MCGIEQKPELGSETCYEKRELRSRIYAHETKSAGAGAMFMKRKAPELEQGNFYDGSAALLPVSLHLHKRMKEKRWFYNLDIILCARMFALIGVC